MILEAALCILASLVFYVIQKCRVKYQYFKKRNIKHLEPTFLFGNNYEVFFNKIHPSEKFDEQYRAFPEEDVVGHYQYLSPQLILRNPQWIDTILIKDFSSFCDRTTKLSDEIKDASAANMFILCGNIWRAVRYKFSPLFTSGKLKYMFKSIQECGSNLKSVLDQNNGKELNLGYTMSCFSIDVIGSTAFGIDAQTLQNPDSKFRKMAATVFFPISYIANARFLILAIAPKLFSLLNLNPTLSPRKTTQYFCDIISNTMEDRKKRGIERNDFVQMLLTLKEKGKIEISVHDKGDDYLLMENGKEEAFELKLTQHILVGASYAFLLAGFHAVAMTLTFTFLEISQKPEILDKIRKEINENIDPENVTYDSLKKLAYLDKVFKETMRMYPTARFITRVCTKEYTLPNSLKVSPGTSVVIPISAIMRDPAYFPEPENFNPDRFDNEPVPGTYLPFGDGPRICIAMRFAMLEMKFAMVEILSSYDIELSEKTILPVKIDPQMFLSTPINPIIFKFKKIAK